LTFSCYGHRDFLSITQTCQWLVDAIQAARYTRDFALLAYVFMPDHVHLIIWPRRREYSISTILQAIKMPASRKAMQWLREDQPQRLRALATGQKDRRHRFWQKGGGYDRNITRVDTLIQAVEYLHQNPVRKGLVAYPSQWYYSSAAAWEGKVDGPLTIDKAGWPGF